ncbi:hypothetical protein PRNP1_010883 [Phytophthora ramorum]
MSKEIEFFNATSAESTSPEASGRGGSTSSAKYRASSRPNSVLLQSATETPDAAQRSLESRLSATNILQRMNKNSASRLSLSEPSEVDASTSGTSGKPKNRFAISTDTAAPAKASGATPKLPQKLRQHVSRLRNQFALGSGAASGSSRNLSVGGRTASASPHKAPRPSMPAAAINSKRFSIAAAAAMQYSRRSNQLQASKETEPETKAPKTPASPQDRESVVSAGTFQDLLRPLQTSLSCASLPAGWSSDEDDDAEQLFRQSERENSRMLRVCCSIDNLMLSIGDRAQEEKQSEAIVRGATRDLMKLYQFATKQVVSVIFDRSEDPSSSNNRGPRGDDGRAAATKMDGKEAQYAMEFLLEINDRIGKLYEFARTVFVDTVDGLRLQRKELEEGFTAAALKNEQLQSEMRDLRDFHEQNNVNAVDTFAIGTSGGRDAVLDNGSDTAAMGALAFPDVSPDSGGDECGALKQQCQELSRLLEMAKQEIRMSHHERDVQKARVAEISSALFHDSELGLLRNQLQSEKKRVRVLERENLTLRESQQEQSLKLQSLEALQTASSASTVALNNNSVTPGTRRMSAVQPQIETTPLSLQQDRAVLHEESVEEEPAVPATQLTVATQDNQYNFVSSVSEDIAPAVTEVNWFSRLVNPPQPANVRKSRKKLVESKPEQQPPVVLSKFLAGLLMTDKQLATAKEESKARRQGSVPTLGPPIGALSASRDARSAEMSNSRKVGGRKQRPRSAAPANASVNSAESEDNHEGIIMGCLQLVWAFYQRFLLAAEAQDLLGTRGIGGDPTMGCGVNSGAGSPATELVSLPIIVFHFFLERCSRERDAVQELENFVRCAHSVRSESYSLELFCQFLEGTCTRQELCFFLWVYQAMDDVRLGIPYDDPLPSHYEGNVDFNDSLQHGPTQFICVLKATFLARSIFRILHFKVLCRPASKGGKRRGKGARSPQKRRSSNPVVAVTPSSPSTSPKRKPKTRLGEITAALAPVAGSMPTGNNAEAGQEHKKISPHVAAQTELREVIENNQDQPISLETFNNLLLKFAVVPSPEELAARLGPFYQPTGDERKIPTDVFLALLMEAYKFQLQWRRDQLRALFIHLNHQEEVHQSAAENLVATATGKEGRRQGGEEKKQPKSRMKRRRSRDSAVENGVGGSKYLRGLSRAVLRDLLLQAEIVHDGDIAQVDVDWLFAQLLQAAGGNAAGITFDALFDALQKMRWLDSSKLRVDALMETTGVVGSSTKKRPGSGQQGGAKRLSNAHASAVTTPSPMLRAVRDKWRVYARHSLVLCNNDPNLFIRRHSQRLLHYVDQHLVHFATESESGGTASTSPDAIQCIREFLTFAWRVAAKRSGGAGVTLLSQACLTEVFLVSQALRVTFDSLPGYQWQLGALDGKTTESQTTEGNPEVVQLHSSHSAISQDALQSFYDTARMDLKLFVKTEDPSKTAAHLHELENVLALYAAHIAHLFQRFSEARFNCAPQVSFHRWRAMVYELDLVHPHKLPFSKLQALFVSVVEALPRSGSDGTNEASLDQELGVGKTQFSELFVLIAMEIRRVAVSRKLEKSQLAAMTKPGGDHSEVLLEAAELTHRPARIMAAFCQEILAPRAFGADNALVERNFAAKLSCPLVGRALLEHRAFLRTVFFYYAKQDEIAEDERAALEEQALIREIQEHGGPPETHHGKDPEVSASEVSAALLQPDPGSDFQLEKTKRSSMSFGEFQNFLTAFGLLDAPDFRPGGRVTLADAQHVFSAVMSLDNDDTLQLEFDEFAAATVALAVHLNPSPFTLWHQKVDDFAKRLRKMWGAQSEAAR